MRQVRHALIVAAVAAVVLVVAVRAEALTQARPESPQVALAPTTRKAPTVGLRPHAIEAMAEPSPVYATIVRPFGASIRVAPALDAAGLLNVACGTALQAMSVESGWVEVSTPAGPGWVGSSRIAVSDGPAPTDCTGKRFLARASDASTLVPEGCLSLQKLPSRDAASLACVGNGHLFTIVDGPFDPGTGEDWFRVSSPSTGSGWVLAEFLYPT